jgi:hypothetical protein
VSFELVQEPEQLGRLRLRHLFPLHGVPLSA